MCIHEPFSLIMKTKYKRIVQESERRRRNNCTPIQRFVTLKEPERLITQVTPGTNDYQRLLKPSLKIRI